MTFDQSALIELQALRDNYAAELPHRIDVLEQHWLRRHETGVLEALHYQVHGLAGSGATFGFTELSKVARQLEMLVKAALTGQQQLDSQTADEATRLVAAIRSAALHADDDRHATLATPVHRNTHENNDIILLDPDAVTGAELAEQLEILGYPCRIAATATQLQAMVATAPPRAAVLDPVVQHSFEPLLDAAGTAVPLIFISARDDFNQRLRGVRAGGRAFFTKPVDALALAAVLDELTLRNPREPYRILIVDDDAALAHYYALILNNAAMKTHIVTDPMTVMKALHDFHPDLMLMDLYMPDCNGLELAAVIRQQKAFIDVPIVFLSGENDGDKQLTAMSYGADDFLNKSISPAHLVGALAARVARMRSMRSLMVSDSLTDLFNHTYIKEQLARELSRATRYQSPLAFAMIDIDTFKSVNDNYGHLAGDRVIKSLARYLKQRLRRSDVIGRYGGEEFAIILPATDMNAAARVLDELRNGFAQLGHHTERGEINVTFSCGIADYPTHDGAHAINDAADKALYRAKQAGRNRVMTAPATEGNGVLT